MAVELKFHRVDTTPWGFRLTGGADLDMPIMVIKVNEGSIAEDAGMIVGDLLVRVGDTPTAGLTHLQVHDLLIEAGNTFVVAVIRGELPQYFTESEETIDTETSHAGLSQSLQINIKTNVVDTTEIIVETGEVVEQNIKINGEVVSNKQDVNVDLNAEQKVSEEDTSQEVMQETEEKQSKNVTGVTFKPTVEFIKDSEVLKVINEEKSESTEKKTSDEKRWTTFLQKPSRPKPKIKQKESEEPKNEYEEHVLLTRLLSLVQEPPYRVIIKKHKKKVDEEKASALERASQQSTPNPDELTSATPELSMTPDQEHEMEEEEQQETEKYEESEQQTAEYEEREDQVISEVEMSLEEQLAAIQKQLLALSQLPAAIQQTLDVVTQQLTKIVGPVNDPNAEENEDEDNDGSTLDDTERETEERTAELETVEEISEGGFDRDSYQGECEEYGEREGETGDEEDDHERELEMLQATPEPEEFLTPEEREKMDKKQKEKELLEDLRQRRVKERLTYPLTPLQRPICLPGGRRWHMPDDAQPPVRHPNMSDDLIAETISAQSEIIIGTTLGDSNTHLVPSKVTETKKINFLKYQPPPQTLDHLKHSEVYRLVHDMEPPARGVQSRQGKAMAEEDYYAQIQKSSLEGAAQQTKG